MPKSSSFNVNLIQPSWLLARLWAFLFKPPTPHPPMHEQEVDEIRITSSVCAPVEPSRKNWRKTN